MLALAGGESSPIGAAMIRLGALCVPFLQGIVVAWRRLNATTHETYCVTEQTDLESVR
jgi:hypothetical protein